jgi:hypothetical protein
MNVKTFDAKPVLEETIRVSPELKRFIRDNTKRKNSK